MGERGLVVVTGAAGFIGGHCCRALLAEGWRVRGLDNFDDFYSPAQKHQTVSDLLGMHGFSFETGDIRDRAWLEPVLEGADAVVHLAARAGVQPSIEQPELYASVNIQGTATLLEACRKAGVRRFVFASSSSVYGDDTPVPFREDAPAVNPISPYGATKRAGELLCSAHSHLHGCRIAALRLFTVYGPRQRPDLAIHRFTRALSEGRPIEQFGDGSSERDYTHVNDIVAGIGGALRWTSEGDGGFEIFNLGESRTVRLDQLIALIAAALGAKPVIRVAPPRAGDVRRTWADLEKSQRVLGYRPGIALETGITEFVSWFRESRSAG